MHYQQFSLKALAAILFSTSVSAHMKMSQPVPYGASSLDNSPLIADGSDFPCKQRTGVYDLEGASNVMAVGSTNTLSFIGSAVHGGGSCQVSLTTDQQPTKDSKWMVIKSLEGGCPADVPGNLPADAAAADPTTFSYTIPQGIAPGQYTIAWSWVNKVGNREFYMNCGPATITAATKKRYAPNAPTSQNKRQATFPDMFVANLAGVSNSCTTTENVDIVYPDGGADITKSSDGAFGPPVGCSGGNGAAAAASPSASAAAAGAATTSAASPAATSSSGIFATGVASPAAPAATETVSPVPAAASSVPASVASVPASVASVPAATASAAPAAASSTAPISSGAVVAGAACTTEGAWACASDGASYQRCASGVWSVSMAMAAGTTCTPGTSMTLSENVTNAKRHTFHARRGHHAFARLT
jgi:hypothetical protein